MAISEAVRAQLGSRFAVLLPHLNERQRRLALATEARLLGHGGVRCVARIAGVSETTVRRGVWELEAGVGPVPDGRVRAAGGGRKASEVTDPGLLNALLGVGRAGRARRSAVAAAVDDQVAATPGRGADPAGTSRLGSDGGGGCSRRRASACRRTSRPSKAPSIPTGMRSSAISTSRSRCIRPEPVRISV